MRPRTGLVGFVMTALRYGAAVAVALFILGPILVIAYLAFAPEDTVYLFPKPVADVIIEVFDVQVHARNYTKLVEVAHDPPRSVVSRSVDGRLLLHRSNWALSRTILSSDPMDAHTWCEVPDVFRIARDDGLLEPVATQRYVAVNDVGCPGGSQE